MGNLYDDEENIDIDYRDVDSQDALSMLTGVGEEGKEAIEPTATTSDEGTTKVEPKPTDTTPFSKAREAIGNAEQSFSSKLTELYKAREKAREKRKRSAERVALGHAIGDLFGAIGAHYVSNKGNGPAIVPQQLAPKSYAKIQALIDEGVADKDTFDKYMLSLTQKKGENDIALAQAQDKAAAEVAMQTRKEEENARNRAHKTQLQQDQQTFDAEQNQLNRESREKVAQMNAENKNKDKGDKNKTLTNWQRRMAKRLLPPETVTTRVEEGQNGLGSTTSTTTSKYEPNSESMKNAYADAEAIARSWGLTLDEAGAEQFDQLYNFVGKKASKNGQVLDLAAVTKVVKDSLAKKHTIADIIRALENYTK